jgi:hypothetical protein
MYLNIINKRKGTAYTDSDVYLKRERNGKWLKYLVLKDSVIKAGKDQGIPQEVLIKQGFPPSTIP